jgi:hypothetical protein
MQLLATLLVLVGAVITPFYFHALWRFRSILLKERPELADRRGSLSFFYTGMPRLADPNVSMLVIRTALGPVPQQLSNPDAVRYARRIRLSLLIAVPAYLVAFTILLAGAP